MYSLTVLLPAGSNEGGSQESRLPAAVSVQREAEDGCPGKAPRLPGPCSELGRGICTGLPQRKASSPLGWLCAGISHESKGSSSWLCFVLPAVAPRALPHGGFCSAGEQPSGGRAARLVSAGGHRYRRTSPSEERSPDMAALGDTDTGGDAW